LSKQLPIGEETVKIDFRSQSATIPLNVMATIDPIQMLYYFVSAFGEIRGLEMTNGNLASLAQLDLEADTYIEFLRYNYADSTIYPLKRNSVSMDFHLCTIDPLTGTISPRSTAPFGSRYLLANGLGTIDPNNEVFYILGYLTEGVNDIHLYGLNLQSGEVVVETPMSGIDDTYFDMMVYFPDMCPPSFLISLSTNTETSVEFAFYPNPAHLSFSIFHPEAVHGADYRLVNGMGQQVHAGKLSHNSTIIDVGALPAGVYIVHVTSAFAKMSRRVVLY